ncbi:MAG: DUF4340 domain-containing protein [Verrucomicrobia bacterium]|nr:DUF4340 domain-containing protein [Verrucomicrobiota bacterium]
MNLTQLRNLVIAAVLITGIGYFVFNQDEGSYKGRSKEDLDKVLPDLDLNQVTRIRIDSPDGSVTLEQKDATWTVSDRGNYPADFKKVGEMARVFEELKALTREEVGESQFARLELLPPGGEEKTGAGTDVSFLDKDGKELSRLRIGKSARRSSEEPDPMGMGMGGSSAGKFVLRTSDMAVFMVSDNLDSIESDPKSWLNKSSFYKVSKAAKVTVQSSEPEMNWTISRGTETDSWSLAGLGPDEKMSTSAANIFNSYMGFPSFVDVSTEQSLMENSKTIKITTFEGFEYTFNVGEKNSDGYYPMTIEVAGRFPESRTPGEGESDEDKAKLDADFARELSKRQEKLTQESALKGTIYLVNSWSVDSGLKKRSEFLDTGKESDEDGNNPISFDDIDTPDEEGVPPILRRPEGMELPVMPNALKDGGKSAEDLINEALENAVQKSTQGIAIPEVSQDVEKVSDEIRSDVESAAEKVAEEVEAKVPVTEDKEPSPDESAPPKVEE